VIISTRHTITSACHAIDVHDRPPEHRRRADQPDQSEPTDDKYAKILALLAELKALAMATARPEQRDRVEAQRREEKAAAARAKMREETDAYRQRLQEIDTANRQRAARADQARVDEEWMWYR
jgi:hypothetical protein